jgi:cytoskeleton protein RodZ
MLRRAREERGLSEQQAAEQLNLDVSVVIALEREDFASLGAPVFAKGHLRRYGGLLGIPEQAALDAYQRSQGDLAAPSLVPRARLEMMPVRARPRWPLVIGGTLAFVLAAGVTAYVSEFGLRLPGLADTAALDGQGGAATADGPAGAGSPSASAVAGATGTASGGATVPGAAAAQAPTATLPVPPGHVSVTIAFATDSWAEIYDGSGKAVLYDLGRAGTQRTIAAAAPLSVTFGNSPGVSLRVNGRPATMPAPPSGGTVARFRIEADGTVR